MEATYRHPQEPLLDSPVFASMFLHGLLIALLVYLIFFRAPTIEKQNERYDIDVSVQKKHATATTSATGSSAIHNRSSGHSSVSLGDLGMRWRPVEPMPVRPQTEESFYSTNESVSDEGGWDVMNPDPKLARFNRYVYNTVQGWLDRDSYLNPAQLTGTVQVRIWFDGEGNYLENETNFQAVDPDFRTLVARALHKSFAVPIPRPFLYTHQKFSILRTVYVRHY